MALTNTIADERDEVYNKHLSKTFDWRRRLAEVLRIVLLPNESGFCSHRFTFKFTKTCPKSYAVLRPRHHCGIVVSIECTNVSISFTATSAARVTLEGSQTRHQSYHAFKDVTRRRRDARPVRCRQDTGLWSAGDRVTLAQAVCRGCVGFSGYECFVSLSEHKISSITTTVHHVEFFNDVMTSTDIMTLLTWKDVRYVRNPGAAAPIYCLFTLFVNTTAQLATVTYSSIVVNLNEVAAVNQDIFYMLNQSIIKRCNSKFRVVVVTSPHRHISFTTIQSTRSSRSIRVRWWIRSLCLCHLGVSLISFLLTNDTVAEGERVRDTVQWALSCWHLSP
ncbi:hypothetical protein J6590_001226 [Homalodisca vitripennis]|nr:hypothetical protein J6590_001226 [Homalodisca vitripennis]